MANGSQQALLTALRRLMRPLVRILLRHGVAFSDFADAARSVFIEVAHDEFPPAGRKQTMSHVAVLTGVHRHEVKKVLARPPDEPVMAPQHNRAARVIDGWLTDTRFSDQGTPRQLSIEPDFRLLVASYSGDITPRSILDELIRVGAVERDDDTLRLVARAYVPHASDDDMLHLFGDCVADLVATIDHNLSHEAGQQRLQISVVHDNLPDDVLRQVEVVSRDKSLKFLRELNEFMKTQDRDSNPAVEGSGRHRAGIGLYYFTSPCDEPPEDTSV